MQRRDFIKSSMSLAAFASLPSSSLARGSQWFSAKLKQDGPIALLNDDEAFSDDFNGDNIDRPHDLLWNIDGYLAKKGGEPPVTEELDTVIVGGGMSGLIAAFYLRQQKVAVLEQDPRFGGNSKGELYKDACYSIGAAYICEPEPGTAIEGLLKNLDIWDKGRSESGDDTGVFFNRRFNTPFWQGATAPEARADFQKLHKRLSEIYRDADWSFEGDFALEHDQWTVDQWLQKEFGSLHPHILEYLQLYGWSSFCGSTNELSAFQYLGFICAETASVRAFPGGNSYIAHKLAQNIRRESGEESLRSGCMVLKVQTEQDAVTVVYEDAFGAIKKIRARHAIMACPKFVAKRLVPEMSSIQADAIKYLPYRAYLVGNILTKNSFQSPGYEMYCLQGQVPPPPTAMNKGQRSFSDICFGSWAQDDQTKHGVLTLYHGIPYDGARQFLFNPASHHKYKNKYLADIAPVLNALNLNSEDVHGVRLTRWGHAVPLSSPGLIANGVTQKASASIGGRIHFANQDNWMNPCFETAHQVALNAANNLLP